MKPGGGVGREDAGADLAFLAGGDEQVAELVDAVGPGLGGDGVGGDEQAAELSGSDLLPGSSRGRIDERRTGRLLQLSTQTRPGSRSKASTPGGDPANVTVSPREGTTSRRFANAFRKKLNVDDDFVCCASTDSVRHDAGCGSHGVDPSGPKP